MLSVPHNWREVMPGLWAISDSTEKSTGPKLFCLSGDVVRPGLYEVLFGVTLDSMGDIANCVAGFGLFDPQHQAFIGHFDQPPRLQRHVADEVHAARIAVPAIEQRGDIDVDDVAVLQLLVARNAVADDMVDRGAAAVREPAIAEGGGQRIFAQHMRADDVVEFTRCDAGDDVRDQAVEHFGSEFPRRAHAVESFGAVELDRAVARGAGVGGGSDISGHAIPITPSNAV